MTHPFKKLVVAVPVLALALSSSTALAQTYKADFSTKVVLAGGGSDVINSITLAVASGGSAPLTWTLPNTNGTAGYMLTTDGAGNLTWTNAAASVAHDATLKVTGGNLGIDLAHSNTWTGDQLLPADATQGNNLVSSVNAGTTAIAAANGGTGQTSYTAGDLLYASGATTVSKLGIGASGTVLHGGGSAPSYGAVVNGDISDGTIQNVKLANSTIGLTNGGGLTVSGSPIALGGSGSVALDVTHANTWTGDQTLPTDATQAASLVASVNGSTAAKSLNADVLNTGSTLAVASHVLNIDLTHANTWTGDQSLPADAAQAANLVSAVNASTAPKSLNADVLKYDATLQVTSNSVGLDLTHANTWSGTQTMGGVNYTATAVAAGGADVNNLALGSTNTFFTISSTANIAVNGIAGGAAGRTIVLVNTGSNTITLHNENASGTAGNRIHLPGASDVIMAGDGSVTLLYDGSTSRWRMISAQ